MNKDRADDYVPVKVSEVGYADENGLEGLISLASDGRSFAMRAFSGETATHMSRFISGDRSSVPSVFNMIEEVCERLGAHLAAVEVFSSGSVLRSDLQFLGREGQFQLKGYRASDAVALALFYEAPILLHRSLLEERADSQV